MADFDPTRIRAVTLDAAGTLITPSRPVGETYADTARAAGASLDSERLMSGFLDELSTMPPLAFPDAGPGEVAKLERSWWRTLVKRVVEKAGGIDAFDRFFEDLYEHYARGGAWRAYADVFPCLEHLRHRGIRIAVVSNFDSRLENILRALEVDGYLDATVYSSTAGAAKPDAGIFRHALELIDAKPEATLHVGDNPVADYEGARRAGLHALLIDRDGLAEPSGSVPSIRSLEQLVELLQV